MLRSGLARFGVLMLFAMIVWQGGSGCGKSPNAILCFLDTDCPANWPKCVQGTCQGGGTEGGIIKDGGGTDSVGSDTIPSGPCTTGQRRVCYEGPAGTANLGGCRAGEQLCIGGKWDTCDGQVLPEAEKCDGKDNNCDGQVDEGCEGCTPGQKEPCYTGPSTTRGKGACTDGTRICLGTKQWGDCEGQVLPSAEICDSKDNNCDGQVDEGCEGCNPGESRSCYTGPPPTLNQGTCKPGKQTCQASRQWGPCAGEVIPQKELCDKLDNDCNGKVDDNCVVCTPGMILPCYPANVVGCKETAGKFTCVGNCKVGYTRCTPAGQWGACESATTPQKEDCNGQDDDCNGKIDDVTSAPLCQDQLGACAGALRRCVNGAWIPCDNTDYAKNNPKAKLGAETDCDGVDNNCNGQTDESCTGCAPGKTQPCYSGPAGSAGKGPCKAGVQTCAANKTWGACVGQVLPNAETCNGIDDDCDGFVDEAFPEQGKTCSSGKPGICAQGIYNCVQGKVQCLPLLQPRTEICNGQDDDCDGQIDEGAQTVTYYRDADGDGYGDPTQSIKACTRPAGYVTNNTDCYDKNGQVFPGQPGFFVNHRGDGSFDYNCDGQQTPRFTKPGDCKNCQSPVIDIGFLAPMPACGKAGQWVDACRFDVGKCSPITITKYQECR